MEERLRAALRAALRSRDPVATAALRSAQGAVDNATAVPAAGDAAGPGVGGDGARPGVAGSGEAGSGEAGPGEAGPGEAGPGEAGSGVAGSGVAGSGVAGGEHFAGSTVGLGAAEVPRRELTDADVAELVRAEAADRLAAAAQYPPGAAADRLRAEAAVLTELLA